MLVRQAGVDSEAALRPRAGHDVATMSKTITQNAVAPVAIGSIALATLLAAVGTWGRRRAWNQGVPDRLRDHRGGRRRSLRLGGAARGLQREAAGATALTLSILGLVAVVAFWSGLTPILAGGGALLGWAGRGADRGRATCRAAIGIGTLALVGYLVIYALDSLS